MQELTIEQLKFARKIGAVYCLSDYQECIDGYFGKPGYVYRDGEWKEWEDGTDDVYTLRDIVAFPGNRFTIDFTPLDELSADNTEQPLEWPISEDLIGRKVRFEGYTDSGCNHWDFKVDEVYIVDRDEDGDIGPISISGSTISRGFCSDFKFTILPEEKEDWPEDRQDAIGQNGNDGEHYEKPETTHDVSHHKRKDGTDLIDEWWNKYEPEVARILMWEMVNKYNNRLGKKDPVHIEVAKMADYMARWSEKEFELANKLGA